MSKENGTDILQYALREEAAIEADLIEAYRVALDSIRAKLLIYAENGFLNSISLAEGGRLLSLQNMIAAELQIASGTIEPIISKLKEDMLKYGFDETLAQYKEKFPNATNTLNYDDIMASIENPLYNANFAASMKGLDDEALKAISNNITQGVLQNQTFEEIAKNIRLTLNYSASRAMTIARTETLRASSQGQVIASDRLSEVYDIRSVKVWISAQDSRTRAFSRDDLSDHLNMNGKEADADGNFHVPYRNSKLGLTQYAIMQAPRLSGIPQVDINCRCGFYNKILLKDE